MLKLQPVEEFRLPSGCSLARPRPRLAALLVVLAVHAHALVTTSGCGLGDSALHQQQLLAGEADFSSERCLASKLMGFEFDAGTLVPIYC